MYWSIYISMYLCINVSMYVCVSVYLRIYASMCVSMYLCVYLYIYIFRPHAAAFLPSSLYYLAVTWDHACTLDNRSTHSKKPWAPRPFPCALVQSVNLYANFRSFLEMSSIFIGLFCTRDLTLYRPYNVVGLCWKRVWGSPSLASVSLGVSRAELAPLSWAALLLIILSVMGGWWCREGAMASFQSESCHVTCTQGTSERFMTVFWAGVARDRTIFVGSGSFLDPRSFLWIPKDDRLYHEGSFCSALEVDEDC